MHNLTHHLIVNPAKEFMDKRSVMEGIIQSALLTPVQREDIDGMVKNAIPEGMRKKHHSGAEVPVISVKPAATKVDPGARHYPGSRYA